MWFLNKNTSLKWEIVDKETIKRLSEDDNYEEVKEADELIDFNSLSWPELKQIAKEKGINTHEMKKEEVISALKALEG